MTRRRTEEAFKTCYCHTCKRSYHHQGIARHRAMHRDKGEDCTITFTNGDTYTWRYSALEHEEEP